MPFIAADTHPDHDMTVTFRRVNANAFAKGFCEILIVARELKLLKLGM